MNIEIVEFYPETIDKKNNFFRGTLHIYLIDIKCDLRGIYTQRKDDKWLFLMPVKSGIDPETKEKVRYPIFASADPAINKELIKEIRRLAVPYINDNFKYLFEEN